MSLKNYKVAAAVNAKISATPALSSDSAQALMVEPVVKTSSTRTTVFPFTADGSMTLNASLTFCCRSKAFSFDCDLELGEYLKETTFAFHRHRRIEHYKLITERVGAEPPSE